MVVILLALCRRIGVIIELFYEAAKCLTSVPVLLIQPVWLILTRTVFLLYWTVVYAYITTLGSFGLLHLIVTVYSRALFITLQRLVLGHYHQCLMSQMELNLCCTIFISEPCSLFYLEILAVLFIQKCLRHRDYY